jgi:hypothetical protein
MVSRRDFLKITGGGFILSAAALGGFIGTRTPYKALSPWLNAGQYEDLRLKALSYAILSPNPHNRQPWEIELIGENKINIYRNKIKNLPETDPFDRQLTIGMGCFIETLSIASKEFGLSNEISYFPAGEDGPVAEIIFSSTSEAKDPLFNSILDRRSCKEPFSTMALSSEQIAALITFGNVFYKKEDVEDLKRITWESWLVEYKTPRTLKESIDLMRFGKKEINLSPDGIDLGGAFLESLRLTGLMTPQSMAEPGTIAYQTGIDMYDEMLNSTPNYILLKTDNNDRSAQINTGKKWARLNLKTTEMGLSIHPCSQALQEYPEMKNLYTNIHKTYAEKGQTIQMLGRLGYGPALSPSPRWSIEEKIRKS